MFGLKVRLLLFFLNVVVLHKRFGRIFDFGFIFQTYKNWLAQNNYFDA